MSQQLDQMTERLCADPPARYDDLKVLFLNCTLKRTPVLSHTDGVIRIAKRIFEGVGASTKVIRPVDYFLAAGLGLDMALPDEWKAGCQAGFDSPEHQR